MSSPVKFISVSLRNFMSYGDAYTTIKLDFSGPILIVGINHDASTNSQTESNGAGKSSIVNAITWCLYDRTLSNVAKNKLINFDNEKNMEVSVIFEKDGKFFKVRRFRKHKSFGGEGIHIFEADTLDEIIVIGEPSKSIAVDSVGRANDQINKIIGMPYEIFSRIIVYSGDSMSFLDLPVTDTKSSNNQTDIIEELMGLTLVSEQGERIKKELDGDKISLSTLMEIEDQLAKQREKYREQLDTLRVKSNQWITDHQRKISHYEQLIEDLGTVDFELYSTSLDKLETLKKTNNDLVYEIKSFEQEHSTLVKNFNLYSNWSTLQESKIDSIKSKLKQYDGIDFADEIISVNQRNSLNKEIDRLENEQEKTRKVLETDKKSIIQFNNELEHLNGNNCPYCLQQFKDSKTKIGEIKSKLAILNAVCQENDIYLNDAIDKLSTVKVELSTIKSIYNDLTSVERAKILNESLESQLENIITETNPHLPVVQTKIDESLSFIVKMKKMMDKSNDKITKLSTEIPFKSKVDLNQSKIALQTHKDNLNNILMDSNPHESTLSQFNDAGIDTTNADKIAELENLIHHKTFLHKLLTKKDSFVRRDLISRNLPDLNEKLSEYAQSLNFPYSISFNSDLTVNISKFKKTLEYGQLSNGQKARANFALALAFRSVREKRYGKVKLCMLDECLDYGLSTSGVLAASTLIKKIATDENVAMFIITHKDEVAPMFPRTLEIELRNGFTTINDSDITSTT